MAVPVTKSPRKYQVPALRRAFAILDVLNQSSTGLSVQEVSRLQSIPYSTAFYLLETMAECGYVQRAEEGKRYTVGYKLLAFRESTVTRRTLSLRALASPLMEELTEMTGLTCHLATLERDEAVYIEKSEPNSFIRLNTWVGQRLHLYCSAVGKALIVNHLETELRELFGTDEFPRRTERTLTTLVALLDDLRVARERGYAFDDGEDEGEGRCVAAPVLDAHGEIVASLGVSGVLSQLDIRKMDSLGRTVKHFAARISERLGYTSRPEAKELTVL